MKSRITDENFNQYYEDKEYNKIILSCINIIIENAAREKKKRIILDYTDTVSFPFMVNIARAALDVSKGLNSQIYIQCKLTDFFKVKKEYGKQSFKRMGGNHLAVTSESCLLSMVRKYHGIYDDQIFGKIFDRFYKVKEN